jgi:hypothetical protein
LTLLGSFIGALIGALTSLYFSRKASKELQRESTRLRDLIDILARYMHNEGVIRAEFDENGNLIKAVPLRGGVGAEGSYPGELTVGEDEHSATSDPDGPSDAPAGEEDPDKSEVTPLRRRTGNAAGGDR